MLACVYVYDVRGHKRLSSFSYWGLFLYLVVIAGFRYRIGTDSVTYEGTYEVFPTLWNIGTYNFAKLRFEPGFLLFASFARTFSPDFMWFQILHAVVVNFVIFRFIKQNTPHKFLCLSFYFVIMFLNLNTQVLRESLAVCCFLLAWPFFRQGKWLQYYLLVLLAISMHTSAIVLLFLPILTFKGIRNFFVFGKKTLIICIVIFVVGLVIESHFSAFFSLLAVTDSIESAVGRYTGSDYSTNVLNINGIIGLVLKSILYPCIALYFLKQRVLWGNDEKRRVPDNCQWGWKVKDFERWEIINVVGLYFIVFSMAIFIFHRYFNYFGLFLLTSVASWAFTFLNVKKRRFKLKFVYWVAIIIPFYLFNFQIYSVGLGKSGRLKEYMIYYPYSSRLNPEVSPQREEIYRFFNVR